MQEVLYKTSFISHRDKKEVLVEMLANHGKQLDKSNQLRLLMKKKDASNPLYLHVVSEYMRYVLDVWMLC